MAALQKLVNLFRGTSEDWTVEKSGEEKTLSRPTYDLHGEKQKDGQHTMKEYKNSVRNPQARGIFNDTKAPFNEIIATERNLSLQQQRQRIRDEILDDCGGSALYANPVNVLNSATDAAMDLVGDCDAAAGRIHAGEVNEFDTCGSKKVFNSFGIEIGSETNTASGCLIASGVVGEDPHFRTIIGRQRHNGQSHMVVENRTTNPTLVEYREGEAYGDTMTQFHHLDGLRDERLCARYGYLCGYQKQ